MRRDFLKDLGIEDKEIIDKILDENSSDIGKAKGELETYKTKVADLEKEITSKDAEIATLKTTAGEVDSLKEKITTLEGEKAQLTSDLDNKLNAVHKTHAIESGIRDAKAKNIKAVIGLLDMDKITYKDGALEGFKEQIEALTKGEDSAFLFDTGIPTPSGLTPSNPSLNGGNTPTTTSLADAVAKALSK